MRTISRDPFSRSELVRDIHDAFRPCSFCGTVRHKPKGDPFNYVYGTERDDRPGRPDWHDGVFCSLSCHNAYHGA